MKKIKIRLVTDTLISKKPNNDFKLNSMLAWEIVSMKSYRDQIRVIIQTFGKKVAGLALTPQGER